MAQAALTDTFTNFARVAHPYLTIQNDEHYEQALSLMEGLLEQADDRPDDPLNRLIEVLGNAIGTYEQQKDEFGQFDAEVGNGPADVAMLRLLMDQHGLGVSGIPEIGDKSLVSRILSGKRNLTKQHIERLAQRFGISPALFFESPFLQ